MASSIRHPLRPLRRSRSAGRVVPGSGASEPSPGSQYPGIRHTPTPINGGQQAPNPNLTGMFDLSTDPIVQSIRAQNEQMLANAEASAAAQRNRLLLQYGDPELARQFGGATAAEAASQNPFSTLKQLQRSYEQGVFGTNEGLNKANLFYSSTRGNELGNLAYALQQGRAEAGSSLQNALAGISQGLLDIRGQATSRETDALSQAYQNALAFSLQYGGFPGGNGSSGSTGSPGAGSGGGGGKKKRIRRRSGTPITDQGIRNPAY